MADECSSFAIFGRFWSPKSAFQIRGNRLLWTFSTLNWWVLEEEPHQSTLDVMRILDEYRRQLGLVYPFEQSNYGPLNLWPVTHQQLQF